LGLILIKSIFHLSRLLHKYLGLTGLFYLLLMAVSGILLNHPSLISHISVPPDWMPPSYRLNHWNRMAMREAVFSTRHPDTFFIAGKTGVWESRDGGRSFTHLTDGFPVSAYKRDTRCLLLNETGPTAQLLAGTRRGLFRYNFQAEAWSRVDRDGALPDTDIVDLVHTGSSILVFTKHACFRLEGAKDNPLLEAMPLVSAIPPVERAPFFRLLLKLHDGSVLGLPGQLVMDFAAVNMAILSISAVYIWYVPWRRKRTGHRPARPSFFKLFYRYHLKLGIITAVFLILFALTGIFLRPPLLIAIVRWTVPAGLLNVGYSTRPWLTEIEKAVFRPDFGDLLLATRQGFFVGPADVSAPFAPIPVNVPVHGMGVFVLESLANRQLLVGSFSGFYVWDFTAQTAKDMNGRTVSPRRSRGHPTDMAAGAAVDRGQLRFRADYRVGIESLPGAPLAPPLCRKRSGTPAPCPYGISCSSFTMDVYYGIGSAPIPGSSFLSVV
jgi:hypothetical protein